VTVTFNAERFLRQALESIINQTYANVELIIIDGGSTDSTIEIIKSFEEKIDFWLSESDKGIYDAMNKGINFARGEWIGFKNADDWYHPAALEILVKEIEKNHGDAYYGNTYSVIREQPLSLSPFFTDHQTIGRNPGIDHRSFFVKADLHKKCLFDINYKLAADLDVFWRLKKSGIQFHHIDSFLAYKRFGGASDGTQILKETFAINKKYAGLILAVLWRFKVLLKYWSWRSSNLILKLFLGENGYSKFKSRKIK
jgi:glycosyltransferase involved in cell wall biosynthesis